MIAHEQNYPRPQFVRSQWTNLNGSWQFVFDDDKKGLAEKWYRHFPAGQTIEVPFSYETARSGIHDERAHDTVWYSRALAVCPQALAGRRLLLHFEGSDYETFVWVNGQLAGSHRGGYCRFSFDITDLLQDADNRLTVCVQDSQDCAQPRGKQRWRTESFGCWYVQTTGLWKTVWLEQTAPQHLVSAKITPSVEESCVDFELETTVGGDPALELAVCVSQEGHCISAGTAPLLQRCTRLRLPIYEQELHEWGVPLWSPASPALYDVTIELRRGGEVLDTVQSYFGLRDVRIEAGNVLLNGTAIYQRLILDQGYWPESGLTAPGEEALVADIDRIRAMGYNGVRLHQKIEDERFLYWCDVKGLLVWCEMPSPYVFSDDAIQDFTAQWVEAVRQNYNHPCIITWVPFNESWGVRQIKTQRPQQDLTVAVYHLTKSIDPMRPVVTNDGWEHTVSDILTLHDYESDAAALLARYAEHWDDILGSRLYFCMTKSAFADGYGYRGQPVILSEYGGIAFAGQDGWGYGSAAPSQEAFLQRFDALTTAVKKIPQVCGYCYTQLTDVQQEVNGLLTMAREPKAAPEALREINLRPVGERDHRMP